MVNRYEIYVDALLFLVRYSPHPNMPTMHETGIFSARQVVLIKSKLKLVQWTVC